jgi:D-inositol-3-phosphate glycosyltransferase
VRPAKVGYYVPDQYAPDQHGPAQLPRRIATISLHTSPLDQPGTGDAGGMNVYVVEVARQLADRGVEVEIFTRAVSRETPPTVELRPGVLVRNLVAGPFEELDKNSLPAQICPFTFGVLRAEAAYPRGRYDLVHSHYWLSGQVGVAAARRWGVPLVHSMHTLGKVKNLLLAAGDCAEPQARIQGEGEVVTAADALVANTADEADQLVSLYGASPEQVRTVSPGVDLSLFRPDPGGPAVARARLGLPDDAVVLVFAGRIQPLKGPDVVLGAAASLLRLRPDLAGRLVVVFVGGPSGSEVGAPGRLDSLAGALGITGSVRQEPPCPHRELADWYRAATAVLVPSHSESFGLVALEAQACGTPVVAARVGGLRTAVRDGVSGLLVDGHDPDEWARVLAGLVTSPARLAGLSRGAVAHASAFGWAATADRLLGVYTGAMDAVGTAGAGPAGAGPVRAGTVGAGTVRAGTVGEAAAVGRA